jgi:integrase
MTRRAVNYRAAESGKVAKLRFHVYPHLLRHSTGYYLENRGYEMKLGQDYLGHKNIAHMVRYPQWEQYALKDYGSPPAKCLENERISINFHE